MKAFEVVIAGLGGSAAILLLTATPAAQASTRVNVPCSGPAGGPAGLIAAISAANATGGATINLAAGCTYQLTAANNTSLALGSNGLPVITSPITLNGSGTTIAGNDTTFRVLEVSGTGNLTLQGLTITGGTTGGMGGGILNLEGTLTLNHSQVSGNAAQGGPMSNGGGIASGTLGTGPLGTTTLNASQVNGNTTSGSAGGILNRGGTFTLNASQVTGNTAATGGGGIASGTGGMGNNTTPTDSSGDQGGGGGIANLNITPLTGTPDSGVLTVSLSQIRGNSASGPGGGILEDGVNPDDTLGQPGGPLTLQQTRVTGNSAAQGGGIFASTGSPVTLNRSLIFGNVPTNCYPPGTIPGCSN